MAAPREPLFIARESYRRRRLGDAAKLVPVLGLTLLLLPALWSSANRTVDAMIYVFTIWALLILLIGALSRRLLKDGSGEEE